MCSNPPTAVPGYTYSCSTSAVTGDTCSPAVTCAAGYTGTPSGGVLTCGGTANPGVWTGAALTGCLGNIHSRFSVMYYRFFVAILFPFSFFFLVLRSSLFY